MKRCAEDLDVDSDSQEQLRTQRQYLPLMTGITRAALRESILPRNLLPSPSSPTSNPDSLDEGTLESARLAMASALGRAAGAEIARESHDSLGALSEQLGGFHISAPEERRGRWAEASRAPDARSRSPRRQEHPPAVGQQSHVEALQQDRSTAQQAVPVEEGSHVKRAKTVQASSQAR